MSRSRIARRTAAPLAGHSVGRPRRGTLGRLWLVGLLVVTAAAALPAVAQATVTVSRAELSGTKLRIEGRALANRTITVDSVAMGTSDGAGNFKIDRDPFAKPANCTVAVNDGSATPTTATLSGCTVSSSPPPPSSSTASLSSLTITPNEVIQGSSATGTVRLTSAAPSGGVVVDLTNDYPHIATVPASVTVPAGSASASFPVATSATTTGSAIIVGTIGGDWNTHKYGIITTYTEFHYNNGSISILPSGTGSGRVTSSPAGIDCTITRGNGSGACSSFFPVATIVRLEARPAADSEFRGWRTNLPGCSDPSRVRIARGTNITCSPGFFLK
jgi:hypothetical protein